MIFEISKIKFRIDSFGYRKTVMKGLSKLNSMYLGPDDAAAFCCMLPPSLSVERLLPVIAEDGLGDLGG